MAEDIEISRAHLQATSAASQRFRQMRYGVSAHWGLYSVLGRDEWSMHLEHIPIEEYEQLAQAFCPQQFHARAWVDILVEAGAEAFLITAKHHDGFCLFDSAVTNYTTTATACKRDLLAELAEACRERHLPLHVYYSLLDWHHPAYRQDWPAYVAYYQEQLRELCTGYGQLGGIIFDGYWPRIPLSPEQAYFRPGGPWDLTGTYDLIHRLQPQAMIGHNHHLLPLPGEDYQVTEIDLPGENKAGWNTTAISALPLAAWFQINKGWSYRSGEQAVKPAEELARLITACQERRATCWLNIGPKPEGELVAEEVAALRRLPTLL